MSKENKQNCTCKSEECKCTPENHCGCFDGKPCTCGEHDHKCHCHDDGCHCTEDNHCGCKDGEPCTCGEHDHKCHCHDDGCHCTEDNHCGCKDGEPCTCGEHHCHCEDDDCDCGCGCDHEHLEGSEEFKKYEQAFIQLENALIQVDQELEQTKKIAEENERLAGVYKRDLERFKQRAQEQEETMKISAVENIADKLIPILDNFEQALKIVSDQNVHKGFSMIEGMLKNAVKSLGIEEIDAEGQEFNPELHNAVSKTKTKDKKKDNTIAKVYQKGYKLAGEKGKVIRPSMVEIYLQD